MSKQTQQRIFIAEKCGWRWHRCVDLATTIFTDQPLPTDSVYIWKEVERPDDADKIALRCPGYPNDLNAMHEAEKAIPEGKKGYYNAELFKLASDRVLSSAIKEPEFIFLTITATSQQRADAFCRVFGKEF